MESVVSSRTVVRGSGTVPLMSQCVAAFGGDGFLRTGLSRELRAVKVDPETARRTLGWHVLDEVLASATLEPNMIRLMGTTGRIEAGTYSTARMGAGQIVQRSLVTRAFHSELSAGATLIVNKADRLHRDVRANRERLEHWVSELAWCNAYATWCDTSAFGRHWDDHDVIILQAEGAKDWAVFDPADDEHEQPVFEDTLVPGDVLHIPRGWPHMVTGRGGPSMHWTFGFRRPTVGDLLADLLPGPTVPRPAQWTDDGTMDAADLAAARDLADDLATRAAALGAKLRRATSKERREGTSLPWSVSRTPWTGAAVRWAARYPPVVGYEGGRAVVETLGGKYRVDGRLAPILSLLESGEAVTFDAMLSGSSLEETQLSAFLDFALREEIVIVERAAGRG
jgi:hypothetical protein